MCVCSRAIRPGTSPSAACGAKASARTLVHPSSVRSSGIRYIAKLSGRTTILSALGRCPCAGFQQAPEDFRDAPRLRDAATGHTRRLGIEDLAERSHTSFAEVPVEPFEQPPCPVAVVGMNLQPRVDEGPDQPRPDGALVIRG